MDGIVEAEQRSQIIFIAGLNLLYSNLEAIQHGTLRAGIVFARIAVLTDLRENLLDQQELVRDKREIDSEFLWA